MNNLSIVGNLTRAPETRTTQDGKTVTSFTVAVNRLQKDKDGNNVADFFRVSAWNKIGENCQKYLSKGKKVGVVGRVSLHVYSAQDGTPRGTMEVFANEVEFLTPNGEVAGTASNPPADVQPNMTPVNSDGKLPF